MFLDLSYLCLKLFTVIREYYIKSKSIDLRSMITRSFQIEQNVSLLGDISIYYNFCYVLSMIKKLPPWLELGGQMVLNWVSLTNMLLVQLKTLLTEVHLLFKAEKLRLLSLMLVTLFVTQIDDIPFI